MRGRKLTALGAAGVAILSLLVGTAGAEKTKGRAMPNLVVSRVSNPPRGLSEGDRFRVSDTTRNGGTGAAPKTATRYYLSKNPTRSLQDRRKSTTPPGRPASTRPTTRRE